LNKRQRGNGPKKNKTSLRSRILLLFIAMWFIVTVVLAGIAIYTQVQAAQSSAVQNSAAQLALTKKTIDDTIKNIDLVGIRLSNAAQVHRLADETYDDLSDDEKWLQPLLIRSLLYEDDYTTQPGHAVTLLLRCGDGRIYSNLKGGFSLARDEKTLNIARLISEKPISYGGYSLDVGVLSEDLLPSDTLVYRRRFPSLQNRQYFSEVIILTNRTVFLSKLKYRGSTAEEWGILNSEGKVLLSDRPEWIGENCEDLFGVDEASFDRESNSVACKNLSQLLVYYRNSDSRLVSINILSRTRFVRSAQGIIAYVVALAALCLVVFILLSAYLSKRLTEPLRKLGRKMYQATGGDMSVRFEPRFNDEIGIIGNQFDTMVDQLSKSMRRLRETEREKRKAELLSLEMQINPHFIYNTLSSIVWLASEGKNDDVIGITKVLSDYLRLSLSKGREFIPVRDEIDHVRAYMNIQNYRYANEVRMLFDVDAAALGLFTPKLLLQPLVENALYHGIKSREAGGGVIRVCASLCGEHLRFEVWDNGVGMSGEKCAELNEALANQRAHGVGTGTVNSRIKLYFGNEYSLSYRRQGDWTIATAVIPQMSEESIHEFVDRGR